MENDIQKRAPWTSFLRNCSIGGMLLLLACSGPNTRSLPNLEQKGTELLRITGIDEGDREVRKQELQARNEVLRILPSSEDEFILLVDASGSDSLMAFSFPERVEQIEKKELAKKFETPEVPGPESGSSFELPNIFDIFTRIY